MSIKTKRCLILNLSWFPIGIETLQDSLIKLCSQGESKGRTFVIGEDVIDGQSYFQRYTFDQWIKRKINPLKPIVRTSKILFEVPEIVMKSCSKLYIEKLPLKASNIFTRDGFKCWYCGSQINLTLDHIIPTSKGGKNSWKNLVTCCKSCNHQKDNMDVNKFCEIKKCKIPEPSNVGSLPWLKALGRKYPESWQRWFNF